jgi:hypothetical protein
LEIRAALRALRRRKPIVRTVTNHGAMEPYANALLPIGALSLVSQSLGEPDELVGLADAIVVNGGTVNERWSALADTALEVARSLGKPAVLDPVGAGVLIPLGLDGGSALTAATAPNATGVATLLALEPSLVRAQADRWLDRIGALTRSSLACAPTPASSPWLPIASLNATCGTSPSISCSSLRSAISCLSSSVGKAALLNRVAAGTQSEHARHRLPAVRGGYRVPRDTWPRCVWWPLPSEALPRTVEPR